MSVLENIVDRYEGASASAVDDFLGELNFESSFEPALNRIVEVMGQR